MKRQRRRDPGPWYLGMVKPGYLWDLELILAGSDESLVEAFGSIEAAEACWRNHFQEVAADVNRDRGKLLWIEQRFPIPGWPPRGLRETGWPPNWEKKGPADNKS